MKWPIQVNWADRMRVVLHPTDKDATILLRPSEGALGGQDTPGGFPASRRNAYPSGANAFFADVRVRPKGDPGFRTRGEAGPGVGEGDFRALACPWTLLTGEVDIVRRK